MVFLDFDFQTGRKRTHKITGFTVQLTSLKHHFWIHSVKSQFRKTKFPDGFEDETIFRWVIRLTRKHFLPFISLSPSKGRDGEHSVWGNVLVLLGEGSRGAPTATAFPPPPPSPTGAGRRMRNAQGTRGLNGKPGDRQRDCC